MSSKIEKTADCEEFLCIYKYTTFLALLFEICIIFEKNITAVFTDWRKAKYNKTVRKKNVLQQNIIWDF
jgi:hypothetical protein